MLPVQANKYGVVVPVTHVTGNLKTACKNNPGLEINTKLGWVSRSGRSK
jgi:hypothetical protein